MKGIYVLYSFEKEFKAPIWVQGPHAHTRTTWWEVGRAWNARKMAADGFILPPLFKNKQKKQPQQKNPTCLCQPEHIFKGDANSPYVPSVQRYGTI